MFFVRQLDVGGDRLVEEGNVAQPALMSREGMARKLR